MKSLLETFRTQKEAGLYNDLQDDLLRILTYQLTGKETIISSRIKSEESLTGKIERKNKYSSIEEITDIVAFRIITKYQDEVDTIKKQLEALFEKDTVNSIDKRRHSGDDFGYGSLHLILSFALKPPFQDAGIDINKYKGIKFEVQVRTVLEHAWAAIEHDLGYKPELAGGMPIPIKRAFARYAALLETCDVGFVQLREELAKHAIDVEENLEHEDYSTWLITSSEDPRTLRKFFWSPNKLVTRIEDEILKLTRTGTTNIPGDITPKQIELLLNFRINSIEELKHIILKNESSIIEIAINSIGLDYGKVPLRKTGVGLPKQFLIIYVSLYIIAANSKDYAEATTNLTHYLGTRSLVCLKAISPYINSRR
jgi:putative GTP pyrophosphokinase